MIVKKTGNEIFQLIQGLNNPKILEIKSTKLHYAIFKSRQKLLNFHKEFLKGYDQDPRFIDYRNELQQTQNNYMAENPDTLENTELQNLLSKINETYKETIEKENKRIESLNNKALNEFELELFGVRYEDLPEDLNGEQLEIIKSFIMED